MPPRLLSAAPASKRSLQANMKSIDKQVEVYQQPLQAICGGSTAVCERKSVLDDEIYSSVDRYPTSKLVGQFFIHELAKRVPPEVVVVNEWNPGLCKSGPVCYSSEEACCGRARDLTGATVKHGAESHGRR
ncbi:hypothetical protein AnigIFM59636_001333 [Aspergillus niger]|nr:hypothetical protein AnigIFM59636_001333 [Aspergillus niger]GLA24544.1 hypothetical protein AnigIFM63326_000594 [Aspergillus niger]